MRRREFLAALGAAAAAAPVRSPAATPRVGFLSGASATSFAPFVAAFKVGLAKAGYEDGSNVAIEFRWAEDRFDLLPALAADLVNRRVDALLASGGVAAALAAKNASSTIPIVFVNGADPVEDGLVASFNRPEGNVTGVTFMATDLMPKRLELLSEMLPLARTIALLVNPNSPQSERLAADVEDAARAKGLQVNVLKAGTAEGIETAFTSLAGLHADALLIGADVSFNSRRTQLVDLASRHSVPTLYDTRAFVAAGGLISYGPSIPASYRRAGEYIGRILKGASIGELPVERSTTFELIINRKTAEALRLSLPQSILARVDEMIE